MRATPGSKSLVAGATLSIKATNQDAFGVAKNDAAHLSGIVVADGVGSHYAAEIGATVVARAIARGLGSLAASDRLCLRRMYHDAWRDVQRYIDDHADSLPQDIDWQNAFGTTAVCAVETTDGLTLGYVGNGGIFHLRGNFNQFPASQLLPWSALNYLNPHSVPRNGKNVMYKLLAPRSGPEEIAPSVMSLTKDDTSFGDIVVCCTDGIYSYDQVAIGRDDEKNIWISGEPAITRLFDSLSTFFDGEVSDQALAACLERYLAELHAANLVSDDCTVAVLITEKALAFQASMRLRRTAGAVQ
jgi:hypothetical protein